MGTSNQIWAGVVQELQIYKRNPLKLLGFYSTAIMSVIAQPLTLHLKEIDQSQTEFYKTVRAVLEVIECIFFFAPAFIMIISMIKQRESNIQNFVIVNGMSKTAYLSKLVLSNCILTLIVAAGKTFGNYIYLEREGFIETMPPFYAPLLLCLSSTMAGVNLCLLISRLIKVQQAMSLCIAWFFLFPLFTLCILLAPQLGFPRWFAIPVMVMNPSVIFSKLIISVTFTHWIEGTLLMIILGALYLGLYLLIEKLADTKYREKKMKGQDNDQQQILELEQGLLENDEMINGSDLEGTKIVFGSVAKYEEEIHDLEKRIALEAKNLKKMYKGMDAPALNGICLKIFEGEIFSLIGHNGAGKTTLLNILCGMIHQTEGDLDLLQQRIGFCSQDNLALPENTIFENLVFWARIKGINKALIGSQVQDVMQKLGLDSSKDIVISKLSIELRKKLCIAIALLNDPQIVFMDEPTSGLDAVSRQTFWEIIRQIKQDKKTVIFTTQFLDDAEILSDRLSILSNGKLFAVGSPEYIKKKFGTGYTMVISNGKSPAQLSNQAEEISRIIKETIPSAELISNTTLKILKYALSSHDQGKFSALFERLQNIPHIQLNLQRTNLEEAFESLERDPDFNINFNERREQNHQLLDSSLQRIYTTGFLSQLKAVIIQRYYMMKVDKKQVICALLLPVLYVIIDKEMTGSPDYVKRFFSLHHPLISQLWVCVLITVFHAYVVLISVEFIIKNRDKFNLLKIYGMKPLPYWLGNFLVDLVLLFPLALAEIYTIIAQLNQDSLPILKLSLMWLRIKVIESGCFIIFLYNLSRWFSSSYYMPFAISVMYFLQKALYFLPYQLNIDTPTDFVRVAVFFIPQLCLIPIICDVESFLNILAALIHFSYVVYKDSYTQSDKMATSASQPRIWNPEPLVQYEISRVEAQENQDAVKMIHGDKIFPNYRRRVLQDLTFGVQKGQIFCLLGPNGSGKTTTFDVLTNQISLTSGMALINNKELFANMNKDYTTGFCSQSDFLLNNLTVEQHLKIYAFLKGITSDHVQQAIEYLMTALDLKQHSYKKVEHLSGGTRRKLSVALAVLGAPDFIVLDEPTTGVDPIGRSQIWTLLKALAEEKRCTVLISTHYMEDAELIADKIGILVNGNLVTVGNISDLRRTYEEHYLTVEGISEGFVESLDEKINKVIPEAVLMEGSNEGRRMYKVRSMAMKFAEICRDLEALTADKKVSGFSINVKTLEQTFLQYAKWQRQN